MKTPDKNQKVALVTGSDRGIGFEIARQLGRMGFLVILTSPNPSQRKKAAGLLTKAGIRVIGRPLDLLNDKQIISLRSFIVRTLGRLDVLVNNAGISFDLGMSPAEGRLLRRLKHLPRRTDYGQGPGILGAEMNIVRATLEVNTFGALKMCQAFAPLMMKARQGRIINISSTLGQLSSMNNEDKVPAYQISKTALNAVTRLVADAVKDYHVAVNSVCPGWTRTRLGGPDAPQSPEEAARDIVWLATRPFSFTGRFVQHRRVIKW